MLTLKLSGWLLLVDIPRDDEDFERPSEDLVDREAIELANRAVLDVLDVGRIVEVAVWCADAAGVECIREDMLDMLSRSTSRSSWSSLSGSAESSKGGRDGREGMSRPSMASILRHTRDGVSSIAAMLAGEGVS